MKTFRMEDIMDKNEKWQCSDSSCGHCAGCYESMRAEFNDAKDEAESHKKDIANLHKRLEFVETALLEKCADITEAVAIVNALLPYVKHRIDTIKSSIYDGEATFINETKLGEATACHEQARMFLGILGP